MADSVENLRAALRRLRTITGIIIDALGVDPAECAVIVPTGPPYEAAVARVSLADCFAETDRLLNADG